MRRLIAPLIALAALGTTAHAADVTQPEPPVPAPVEAAPPVFIWSGPYAGAFVGYNFSNFDNARGADFDGEGMVGGVYAGFNLQNDRLVYGIEGDIGASGVDAGGFDVPSNLPTEADNNVFGSVRGRVGFSYEPFLLFATGGVAVADNKLQLGAFEDEKTHVGYTVGAGVEAKVTDNLAARLEYRFTDFDKRSYDLGPVTTSTGFDENSIRAGIALKF